MLIFFSSPAEPMFLLLSIGFNYLLDCSWSLCIRGRLKILFVFVMPFGLTECLG